MMVKLSTTVPEQILTEALVIVLFGKESPGGGVSSELAGKINSITGGVLEDLFSTGEFLAKPLETVLMHRPLGLKAKRLLLVGAEKSDSFSPAELRRVSGAALRHLKSKSITDIVIALDASFAGPEFVSAAAQGAILGEFEPDRYKTEKKNGVKTVESITIAIPKSTSEIEEALERGRIIAEAQNYARDLISEPANRMNPGVLAQCARETGADLGLECEVLDRDRMSQLGMGALLGVAQGSAEPPVLIVLRYKPVGGGEAGTHLGLVGKGVTFDTGGISIKPSEGMEKMKYDMAGGATMIAAMRAIAQLKPAIPVTALIPAVENMPGSRAQRPGDIVKTFSGKTVEVLNTDAEGRLILADALAYARHLGCTHLVDAATLTGAIVVALGHVNVGVFGNDQGLLDKLLTSAKTQGEKMWPMPLDDDYKESLKSAFADMPNIGNRWGGAITAAMFLKEFVENTPWVHLDIAGTAWLDDSKPFMSKGPSGVSLRTVVDLALNWS